MHELSIRNLKKEKRSDYKFPDLILHLATPVFQRFLLL